MEQSCNFKAKTISFVTLTFLNQSRWDLVCVNIYSRCFDTPNIVLIGWETAEFWGLICFTRPEGYFKWDSKNKPFSVWTPQLSSYNNALWICCSPIHYPKVLLLGLFGIPFNLATGRAQRRVLWSKIANWTVLHSYGVGRGGWTFGQEQPIKNFSSCGCGGKRMTWCWTVNIPSIPTLGKGIQKSSLTIYFCTTFLNLCYKFQVPNFKTLYG